MLSYFFSHMCEAVDNFFYISMAFCALEIELHIFPHDVLGVVK